VCGAERAPSGAHALPLCLACCLRSLWPGGPAGCPACFGYATRSSYSPTACCSSVSVLCMYARVHRAHLSALGSWAHPGCTGGCSPEKARPSPQRRAFSVPSTTPTSTTPSTTLTPAKKVPSAITEFRTSWGGLISRLLGGDRSPGAGHRSGRLPQGALPVSGMRPWGSNPPYP
jgi:hypothetical protein